MESALYGIYALVFVSENSYANTVRAHFPRSNPYIFPLLPVYNCVLSNALKLTYARYAGWHVGHQ